MAQTYADKSDRYFVGARRDFVALLPANPAARILEIGCGSGETGELAIKAGKAGHFVGVELFPEAASRARQRLHEVHVGNAEEMTFDWPAASFDALVLSEVLEHLVDPWALMRRLSPLMRTGGMVLASSPNIAHWRIILNAINGRFELAGQGPMDRTHMRWFTPRSFAAMFEAAGFEVTSARPVTPFSWRSRLVSRLTGGRYDHLFMPQVAITAIKR